MHTYSCHNILSAIMYSFVSRTTPWDLRAVFFRKAIEAVSSALIGSGTGTSSKPSQPCLVEENSQLDVAYITPRILGKSQLQALARSQHRFSLHLPAFLRSVSRRYMNQWNL